MSASLDLNQSFPQLAKLLGNLRSGLKQFGLSEIEDLLRGRNDRDFRKKTAQKSQLLQDAVREIQIKCVDLTYSPDPGHIKFLLWQPVSKRYWDAEKVGQYIVGQLRPPDQERLVCIALFDSVLHGEKNRNCIPWLTASGSSSLRAQLIVYCCSWKRC